MKSATHIGTCQACGNAQKLPNGVLSNHGYTKQWGFFNGICAGAKRAPFEQSCDFIVECIENAQLEIERLKKQAETTRQSNSTTVKVRTYIKKSRFYTWVEGTVDFENKCVNYYHPEQNGKIAFYDLNAYESSDEENLKKINEKFAKSLEKTISEYERYVEWQKGRIVNWKQTELKPI